MICPRCDTDKVEVMVTSPVPGAWEAYICQTCWYSWRSTETPDKTDPKQYSAKFKIKAENIPNMLVIPAIPPLK
ncbi:MAG TPA: non-oxidative hydroxyarylic acid decarboxylases subunit D [Anaerolineales bacterium]|jgi:protein-arginine kinase activator protein McsA